MPKSTIIFKNPPTIAEGSAVGGNEESKGPLSAYFDKLFTDPYLGESSWEKAESRLQYNAVNILLQKASLSCDNISVMFGGDLINQCTSTYFSARDLKIPLYGIYGACSTIGEAMHLSAMAISGNFMDNVIAVTSSHFCSSEKQFRFPLEYGGQRPPTSQWTVTAAGALLITSKGNGPKIQSITTGKIVDMGITDAGNMGAAMAPAAANTIKTFFEETNSSPKDFDQIITGDLGKLGSTLLCDLLLRENIDIRSNHSDCGCLIYDIEAQDKHCGGSGCGASASVFAGYILNKLKNGEIKNVLFIPTGALMSPLSCQQGESISGVAHALHISSEVVL